MKSTVWMPFLLNAGPRCSLEWGPCPVQPFPFLADMGYILGCESDVHGTITMALLACASLGQKVPFFGEFTVRHPEQKKYRAALALWALCHIH